jgi:hypothetical protein
MSQPKRNLAPLSGALFVVLVLIAFIPLGGNTPEGDDSAQKVVSFYSDHETREIIASIVLALGAVSLLFFSATLRQRLEALEPGRGILPTVAFGAGVVASGGFLAAASLHFALADFAGDIQGSAAQALNAIDSDFFLPFAVGIAALVLATSLWLVRTKLLLPTWLGWVGIVLFVVSFTPVGFIAFGLDGIWIIVVSILLYLRGEPEATRSPAAAPPPAG